MIYLLMKKTHFLGWWICAKTLFWGNQPLMMSERDSHASLSLTTYIMSPILRFWQDGWHDIKQGAENLTAVAGGYKQRAKMSFLGMYRRPKRRFGNNEVPLCLHKLLNVVNCAVMFSIYFILVTKLEDGRTKEAFLKTNGQDLFL